MTEDAAHEERPRRAVRLDLGRRLRVLAGVDEGILDQVPLERTRYVGLGGVILGTAVIAGVSMWFALSQIIGEVRPGMVVLALVWMLIVLNLDRWLVSMVAGMWQRRLVMLLPRLLVAMVLGSVIAEPLVLRVFETAVVQHVADEREAARSAEKALLTRCNPATGTPPAGGGCEKARLLVSSAAADEAEIADLEKDAARLQKQVDGARSEYRRLSGQARDECVGKKIIGVTSGKRGVGPLCRRLEAAARTARSLSDLDGNEKRLRELRSRISELRAPLASKRSDLGRRTQAAIDARLAAMPSGDAPVGILERMRALHEIAAENSYLLVASWLLRLFLVLVDCLPVLVKLLGGTTTYDRMVEHANRMRERVHEKRIQLDADARVGELELEAYARAEERRKRRQLIELDGKAADAEARAHREELMNRRAEELNRRSKDRNRINGSHPDVGVAGAFR
ncbi:DUF4407 domain-containing protein [Streptosporangium algeriense]|uniref:DUF4407 domain-containing protein n=1 Tax=Streptosporangium algeriense TaxID=1682748 RepID=A0ABW3DIA1_9ACTN